MADDGKCICCQKDIFEEHTPATPNTACTHRPTSSHS